MSEMKFTITKNKLWGGEEVVGKFATRNDAVEKLKDEYKRIAEANGNFYIQSCFSILDDGDTWIFDNYYKNMDELCYTLTEE